MVVVITSDQLRVASSRRTDIFSAQAQPRRVEVALKHRNVTLSLQPQPDLHTTEHKAQAQPAHASQDSLRRETTDL